MKLILPLKKLLIKIILGLKVIMNKMTTNKPSFWYFCRFATRALTLRLKGYTESKQKIYRSNARLHIFLIQNGFYIDFQTFFVVVNLTTYLATLTSILLLTDAIRIVNNGNILTDRADERKYLEKKYNEL